MEGKRILVKRRIFKVPELTLIWNLLSFFSFFADRWALKLYVSHEMTSRDWAASLSEDLEKENLIGPTGVTWLAVARGAESPSLAANAHARERGWEGTQKVFTTEWLSSTHLPKTLSITKDSSASQVTIVIF